MDLEPSRGVRVGCLIATAVFIFGITGVALLMAMRPL